MIVVGVTEHTLLGENGLARPGDADDQRDPVSRQPATQHPIETVRAGGEPLYHGAARPRRMNALRPSRSWTVETSCKGSMGRCRNADAPASSAASRSSSV